MMQQTKTGYCKMFILFRVQVDEIFPVFFWCVFFWTVELGTKKRPSLDPKPAVKVVARGPGNGKNRRKNQWSERHGITLPETNIGMVEQESNIGYPPSKDGCPRIVPRKMGLKLTNCT